MNLNLSGGHLPAFSSAVYNTRAAFSRDRRNVTQSSYESLWHTRSPPLQMGHELQPAAPDVNSKTSVSFLRRCRFRLLGAKVDAILIWSIVTCALLSPLARARTPPPSLPLSPPRVSLSQALQTLGNGLDAPTAANSALAMSLAAGEPPC